MKQVQQGVEVSIMGKQFSVACPESQRTDLLAAAAYLDEKMAEVHASGKVIGLERCAIMAALNITHELLTLKRHNGAAQEYEDRLRALQRQISGALGEQREIEL